jgi:hypothetical protein
MSVLLSPSDFETLRLLEESLWREETRFDTAYLETVLAADFWEIGRSGRVYSRSDILAVPWGPIDSVLPLPDFSAHPLSADVVQVTYRSIVTYEGGVELGHRSSIWSRTPDGWVLRFHQGTPYSRI